MFEVLTIYPGALNPRMDDAIKSLAERHRGTEIGAGYGGCMDGVCGRDQQFQFPTQMHMDSFVVALKHDARVCSYGVRWRSRKPAKHEEV